MGISLAKGNVHAGKKLLVPMYFHFTGEAYVLGNFFNTPEDLETLLMVFA